MKKLLLLLLFLPLVSLAQITTKVLNGGPGVGNYNMAVYDPPGFDPTKPDTAIIMIPGIGQWGSDVNQLYVNGPLNMIKAGTSKPNYIVIAVQPPYGWPPASNAPPLFMRAALKEILTGNYGVDPSRWYLTGLSDGALLIYQYIQQEVDSLFRWPAAIAPMSMAINALSGSFSAGTDALSGNDFRFKKIPFLGYCGASDPGFFLQPMVRYDTLLTRVDCIASVTTYPGQHNSWNLVYDPKDTYKLYSRLFQYRSGAVPTNTIHARLWVDSLVIHYPTTSVLLKDSSTGAANSDILYTVNGNDNTGRFSVGDLSQGILLANLIEGSYTLNLVASDNAGHSDTATATIQVYGPAKCPAPRKVISLQISILGAWLQVPLSASKMGYDDGSTQ